jgi:hypothetical protein
VFGIPHYWRKDNLLAFYASPEANINLNIVNLYQLSSRSSVNSRNLTPNQLAGVDPIVLPIDVGVIRDTNLKVSMKDKIVPKRTFLVGGRIYIEAGAHRNVTKEFQSKALPLLTQGVLLHPINLALRVNANMAMVQSYYNGYVDVIAQPTDAFGYVKSSRIIEASLISTSQGTLTVLFAIAGMYVDFCIFFYWCMH